MTRLIPRAAPTLVLLLAACSPSAATHDSPDGPLDAVRVAMPAVDPAPLAARAEGAEATWVSSPDAAFARYGYPGEPPLLSVECRAGVLVITRHVAAPIGAEALFALQGSGMILRLPVDATAVPGQRGYAWQGAIAADDPSLGLFGGAFTGTLPGGGHIAVPASDAPRDVVRRCGRGT